jgi:lipid II:glycine glycyltransferase (peptidoglycan interpeptide bridge formation enzyme)
MESVRSRALPGHRTIWVSRLGAGAGGLDESGLGEMLDWLVRMGKNDRSVLRITVEVFSLEAERREVTARTLERAGFSKVPASRSYERTLLLDLSPGEDALFAALHKNARQGVRNIARYPVRLTTVSSAEVAPRLQQLADETRGRTGGSRREIHWESMIEMSLQAPQLSRISILERTDSNTPERVIAFAWGCMHGNVAEYSESGSIRTPDMKISTSYALLWDLILWARRGGARYFDLGGITSGITHSDDPLGGISDFKRRFSQSEMAVGEQFELVPRPRRASVAALVSRVAERWAQSRAAR